MSRREAKRRLGEVVDELERLPRGVLDEMRSAGDSVTETTGSDGARYTTLIQFIEETDGSCQVIVSVDDGGWSSVFPPTSGFEITSQ